jgi:arsenate reductase
LFCVCLLWPLGWDSGVNGAFSLLFRAGLMGETPSRNVARPHLSNQRSSLRLVNSMPPTKPVSKAKLKVLFLCTGNSCRSQMAEGWARTLRGDVLEAASAGVETHGLNPLAVRVMAEAGVDISGQRSKTVDGLLGERFDLVVTVCDHAREACPVFPGATRMLHRNFDDPPYLARAAATEDEALEVYRRVRDEIRVFVEGLPRPAAGAEERPEGGASSGGGAS